MTLPQQLTAAYKAVCQIQEVEYPADFDAESVAEECEDVVNGILRLLHMIEPKEYLECVTWDVERSNCELKGAT